ncbi:MAG: sigma-54-dependent Fis family transcriptional regulator [Deltaproteobacteria bacterium]|nr:sigma-54-dependent Fis family transcriptional regulator [Deltaproteobacteria bacterium]
MNNKSEILVVDDDSAHRTMLRTLLNGWEYDTIEADDGSTAVEKVKERPFDLVLMDVRMLKVSGLEALDEIKAFNPAIPVIIMTAYSSLETAVDAIKKGAYDYLTKPLDFDKLKITIKRAMEHIRLKQENRILKESLGTHFDRQSIIGQSPAMIKLLETVSQVAASEATVLINGESGTGKELIAGAIHFNSPRKDGPFVKINCAAITETLLESELFGHERGAFTGADKRKDGRFVQAHKGSLFLDEVSEMTLAMQAKLLRVIQEREITRVGGDTAVKADVRVIGATNRNLMNMIKEGMFREDLFYRLNVISLDIPPLRKRRDDIVLLAQHFMKNFTVKNRKQIKGFTPKAIDRLIRYEWPGNVRELMNAVERAVVLARAEHIDDEDLAIIQTPFDQTVESTPVLEDMNDMTTLANMEKTVVIKTLKATDGNKSEAARRLGITRKTLHKKLKKYGTMP